MFLLLPVSRTTPSIGLARMDSSTSIDTKLRYNMAVGRNSVSPFMQLVLAKEKREKKLSTQRHNRKLYRKSSFLPDTSFYLVTSSETYKQTNKMQEQKRKRKRKQKQKQENK